MQDVLLICRDLMTASRLELADGVRVTRAPTGDRALELAAADGARYVAVVDLATTADLSIMPDLAISPGIVATLAFAPHVRTDLLTAARPNADRVVARGAVMQDLRGQVERAVRARRDAQPPDER